MLLYIYNIAAKPAIVVSTSDDQNQANPQNQGTQGQNNQTDPTLENTEPTPGNGVL